MQRVKNIYELFFISIFFVISCNGNQTDKVNAFLSEYINTVSMEHAKYKKNITEKLEDYYIDHDGKKTDMPYFIYGSFRDNIVIVRDYEILYTKEIELGKLIKKGYEVKVRFTIENNEADSYQKDELFWVCLHKHRLYIYYDDFCVKDIFILKKDLQLMEQ